MFETTYPYLCSNNRAHYMKFNVLSPWNIKAHQFLILNI